jgi:hypothetical protein
LWQKIFGSPTPKSEDAPPAPGIDREEAAETGRREFEAGEPAIEERTEPFADRAGTMDAGADVGDEVMTEQPTDERKRRRSRRGRGRQGRESQGERPRTRPGDGRRRDADLLETPGADDFDDLSDDISRDDDFAAAIGDDEDSASENGDGSATGEAGAGGRSAGHRSIPSWEDAIGMIVDANLQARPQRRSSGGSGQRGRPRGGRRRRKPS